MAISRDKKEEVVKGVKEALERSKLTVLVNYKGLNVEDTQQLRRQLQSQNIGYTVAKNTLVKKALEQVENLKGSDSTIFSGPVALAFGYDDEAAPAQALMTFAKTHPVIDLVGAINADGSNLSADEVKELAKLPSKDQLRAMTVGGIAAPLSGFVSVIAGNIRGLMNVLNAKAQEGLGSSDFEILEQSEVAYCYEWPVETTLHHYQKTQGELFRGQAKITMVVKFNGQMGDLAIQPGEGLRSLKWVAREKLVDYLIFPGQLDFVNEVIAKAKKI